jgi:hypothetical protein
VIRMTPYRRVNGPFGSSRVVSPGEPGFESEPARPIFRSDLGRMVIIGGEREDAPIEPEKGRAGWIVVLLVAVLFGRFLASLVIR